MIRKKLGHSREEELPLTGRDLQQNQAKGGTRVNEQYKHLRSAKTGVMEKCSAHHGNMFASSSKNQTWRSYLPSQMLSDQT